MGRLRGGKTKFEEQYTKIKTMEVPVVATTNKIESLGAFYGYSNAAVLLHKHTKLVYETTRIWEQGHTTTQKSDEIHRIVTENDSTTN